MIETGRTAVAILLLLPAASMAQPLPSGAAAAAEIVVAGQGTVTVPPTFARISLQIDARGRSAAEAGAENSRRVRVVLDTLRGRGVPDSLLVTARYVVQPTWRSDRSGREPRPDGYVAQNSIQLTVRALEQVGPLIDAALGAGATQVMGIAFHADREASLQLMALDSAVRQARERASVMARASGGTLGALRQLTTERDDPYPGIGGTLQLQSQVIATSTTAINAGNLSVTVTVRGRWALAPDPRAPGAAPPP